MSIKKNIRIWPATLLLLLLSLGGAAQVVVERSKDKVIISGTPYYIHQVRKGETAYSISRAYNVTVEELTKENPPIVYGVKDGQSLRIPVREPAPAGEPGVTRQAAPRDEARFIYHRIQRGETIYSLSKSFGVSENDIVSSNPGIEISRLPVNSEIAIPRRDFMTTKQDFSAAGSNFIFHKVSSGESLASIAEKYGLSVRELRRENRDVRFPQVGDFLRIPGEQVAEEPVAELSVADTLIATPDSVIPVPPVRPKEYTPVRDLSATFDVAVMLPFYLKENAVRTEIDSSKFVKGKRQYKTINRPEDWIYLRSLGFLELYQGILLAADTLRNLGLNINLHAFDIGSDTFEISRLIRQGRLSEMDLIIGPVYSGNLSIVAKYASGMGIPVISPVRLMENTVLTGNPTLFLANPSLEAAQEKIISKAAEYYNQNFVFVHNDTAGYDPEVTRFRNRILNELGTRLPADQISFKELVFYSRSAFGNDSINRLGHSLSATNGNIVIIASEEDAVISESLQEIHNLSRKFQIQTFVYPSVRGIENLDSKYMFELDLLVYSPFWIDYSQKDVKQFIADYRKKFATEPSQMSSSWLGYDITYYFLSGLAIRGRDFIKHPGMHNPDLLQTIFEFRQADRDRGFENYWLFPLKYSRDYTFRLLEDTVTADRPAQ